MSSPTETQLTDETDVTDKHSNEVIEQSYSESIGETVFSKHWIIKSLLNTIQVIIAMDIT